MNFNKLPLIVFLLALCSFPFAGFGKDNDQTNIDIKERKTRVVISSFRRNGYYPDRGFVFKVSVINPSFTGTGYGAGLKISANKGNLAEYHEWLGTGPDDINNINPKTIQNDSVSWWFTWYASKNDSLPVIIKAKGIIYKTNGTIDENEYDTTSVTINPAQPKGKPIISDVKAYGIYGKEANIRFSINPNGGSTTYTLDYGLTTEYEERIIGYDSLTHENLKSINGDWPEMYVNFLSALKPNTVYHYRIKARNKMGIVYSDDYTFKTLPAVSTPQLHIQNVAVYDSGKAVIYASARANGSPTNIYIEYGPTETYGDTVRPNPPLIDSDDGDNITANLKMLKPNTLYHYRIVGVNSAGTGYSEDATFTTK